MWNYKVCMWNNWSYWLLQQKKHSWNDVSDVWICTHFLHTDTMLKWTSVSWWHWFIYMYRRQICMVKLSYAFLKVKRIHGTKKIFNVRERINWHSKQFSWIALSICFSIIISLLKYLHICEDVWRLLISSCMFLFI